MSATVPYWPALDTTGASITVLDENGSVVPVNGISVPVPLDAYYRRLIASGLLLDYDPRDGGGTPSRLYSAGAVQAVLTEAILGTFVGDYDGAQASTIGATVVGDESEKLWRWDASSTATPGSGVIAVPGQTVGRWLQLSNGGSGLPDPSALPDKTALIVGSGAWDERQLTLDDLGPAFAITSWAKNAPNGATLLYERGTTLTGLAAAAAYAAGPPSAASITETYGGSTDSGDTNTGAWSIATPFASASRSGSIKRNGSDLGADPTIAVQLSATGATTKTSTITMRLTSKVYWGVSASVLSTASDVLALASNQLIAQASGVPAGNYAFTPSTEYLYLAWPKERGAPNTIKDLATGFGIPFEAPVEVAGVTSNGVARTYYLMRSSNQLAAAVTAVVT